MQVKPVPLPLWTSEPSRATVLIESTSVRRPAQKKPFISRHAFSIVAFTGQKGGAVISRDDPRVLASALRYRSSDESDWPFPAYRRDRSGLFNVCGTTFKALIHEKFGDCIMGAIDFKTDLQREPTPTGDRFSITMSGKFLPRRTETRMAKNMTLIMHSRDCDST